MRKVEGNEKKTTKGKENWLAYSYQETIGLNLPIGKTLLSGKIVHANLAIGLMAVGLSGCQGTNEIIL